MRLIRNTAQAVLGLNLATVLRLVRFGPRDALKHAISAYALADPFSASGSTVIAEGPEEPEFPESDWDETIASTDAGPLHHTKPLDLADFRHPELIRWVREVYSHERRRFGPRFPDGCEDRKQWEVAMIIRALADYGAIRPDSVLLGVGVGNDPTSFYLTDHVRRVYATDLYLAEDGLWKEADISMLRDPGLNWPFSWKPRRLVTQHMSGRSLMYEDNTFDGVFSAGSIEHFGTLEEIREAAGEAHRVLKPGGIFAFTTELRIDGPGHGGPGLIYFTPDLIGKYLVGDLSWDVMDSGGYEVSSATKQTVVSQRAAVQHFMAHVRKYGRFLYHQYKQVSYPIVTMEDDGYVWTSVCLVLRKR